MKLIKRLVLMIQFFTRIPITPNYKAEHEDYGRGLIFAPLVGLIIGEILACAYIILNRVLPAYICVVLVVVIYIIVTGGLHFDGLGDSFDGIFSNRPKEKILEIMRDSRVGTNAVLAIICILLLDISLLLGINKEYIVLILLLMPVAGRIASTVGAGVSKYARNGEGIGKSFIEYCGSKEIIIGLVIYFAIFYLTAGFNGLIISILPPISAFVTIKLLGRKIGGATGDTLGATLEINQTIFLLAVCILQNYAIK
ncbi:MAG: adenosylcobinamide-GDP ribazoletransferase [Clostridia bacterium]|jgi:adenosylcobinamide-GDP ribazoletransferase